MPSACPRFVFACFKRVERWGDRLTGAAGPFFVAIATLLFVVGTLCFRRFSFLFLIPNQSFVFSRCHSPLYRMALAVHFTMPPHHPQLVYPLLLRLHSISRLR